MAAIAFVLTGAVVVPGSATPASADIAHDIASARARLSVLSAQTEAATERFNAGRIALATAMQVADDAESHVRAANAQVRLLEARHASLASSAYGQSGLEQLSILLSGDPQTALDRVGALDALARRQQAGERSLRLARHDLTEAQTAATAALAEQSRQVASLAAQKQRISASVAAQQKLLSTLVARQAELVRQARAREAAARAARARAAAAAQARAAAAAQVALEQQAALTAQAGGIFSNMPLSGAPQNAVAGSVPSGPGAAAAVAIRAAFAELGKPYVWAAAGPDAFDCSGLTQWAWAAAGISLGHYTGTQWNEGVHVSQDQLQPGDLVFFGADLHHVGIYLGGGQMIDAPHTGSVVRVEGVWWGAYAGAVRVTG